MIFDEQDRRTAELLSPKGGYSPNQGVREGTFLVAQVIRHAQLVEHS